MLAHPLDAPDCYLSDHYHPLMCNKPSERCPIITVENYEKWYSVYLLHPDGKVEAVPPEVLELVGCYDNGWWYDHVFHPKLLIALAKHYKGWVPDTTLEIVTGRWISEGPGMPGYEGIDVELGLNEEQDYSWPEDKDV